VAGWALAAVSPERGEALRIRLGVAAGRVAGVAYPAVTVARRNVVRLRGATTTTVAACSCAVRPPRAATMPRSSDDCARWRSRRFAPPWLPRPTLANVVELLRSAGRC
jgi:hypothetical protein